MQWPVQPRKRSHLQKRWGNEGRKLGFVHYLMPHEPHEATTWCTSKSVSMYITASGLEFLVGSCALCIFIIASNFQRSPAMRVGMHKDLQYHLGIWQCNHLLVEKLHHTVPPCTGCTTHCPAKGLALLRPAARLASAPLGTTAASAMWSSKCSQLMVTCLTHSTHAEGGHVR